MKTLTLFIGLILLASCGSDKDIQQNDLTTIEGARAEVKASDTITQQRIKDAFSRIVNIEWDEATYTDTDTGKTHNGYNVSVSVEIPALDKIKKCTYSDVNINGKTKNYTIFNGFGSDPEMDCYNSKVYISKTGENTYYLRFLRLFSFTDDIPIIARVIHNKPVQFEADEEFEAERLTALSEQLYINAVEVLSPFSESQDFGNFSITTSDHKDVRLFMDLYKDDNSSSVKISNGLRGEIISLFWRNDFDTFINFNNKDRFEALARDQYILKTICEEGRKECLNENDELLTNHYKPKAQ